MNRSNLKTSKLKESSAVVKFVPFGTYGIKSKINKRIDELEKLIVEI